MGKITGQLKTVGSNRPKPGGKQPEYHIKGPNCIGEKEK